MTWWKLLVRKYNTLSYLSAAERGLLVRALYLLPIVTIMLDLKGLRFTQDWLMRKTAPHQASGDLVETQIWETVRMVRIATRYHQHWANCLKQSLVLWILLRDRGIISEVRIGIERESTKFSAHAWVEYQGIVLNDTEDVHQRYQAFDRLFEQPVEAKP
jgi:hypothetical protein